MPVEFDIRPVVQKNTELPFERLRVVQHLNDFVFADIRTAVVFVFAAWSGPAIMALRRFTRILSTLDLGSLDVIILDNDSMTHADMIRLFGRILSGAGEVFWVRDGQVIAALSAFPQESEVLVLSHTKELLGGRTVSTNNGQDKFLGLDNFPSIDPPCLASKAPLRTSTFNLGGCMSVRHDWHIYDSTNREIPADRHRLLRRHHPVVRRELGQLARPKL